MSLKLASQRHGQAECDISPTDEGRGATQGRGLDNTMSLTRILTLLLALSGALNVAFGVGIAARRAGANSANALLTAAGAGATAMGIFFAGVSAYH